MPQPGGAGGAVAFGKGHMSTGQLSANETWRLGGGAAQVASDTSSNVTKFALGVTLMSMDP